MHARLAKEGVAAEGREAVGRGGRAQRRARPRAGGLHQRLVARAARKHAPAAPRRHLPRHLRHDRHDFGKLEPQHLMSKRAEGWGQTRAGCPMAPPPVTPEPQAACGCQLGYIVTASIGANTRQLPRGATNQGMRAAHGVQLRAPTFRHTSPGAAQPQGSSSVLVCVWFPLSLCHNVITPYLCCTLPITRSHRAVPGHELDELAAPVDADQAHILLHARQVQHAPPRACAQAKVQHWHPAQNSLLPPARLGLIQAT